MILTALGLFVIACCFSAFFSGSETGFYRASRARIVMNAIRGNWLDRFVLFLTNQPALMVATVLIGNNIANYLVSLSIVLATSALFPGNSSLPELIAPILLTPFLFVYGESLPKAIFFKAPTSLLRRVAPFLAVCSILLSPAVLLLWSISRGIERLLGQSPERVRLVIGRREMEKVLEESEEIGLLHPSQRRLSQSFFLLAPRPVRDHAIPPQRMASMPAGKPASAFLETARRHSAGVVLVTAPDSGKVVGYVRVVDLLVLGDRRVGVQTWRPLPDLPVDEKAGEALMQMQTRRHDLARLVSANGTPVGYLLRSRLVDPLFQEAVETVPRGSDAALTSPSQPRPGSGS